MDGVVKRTFAGLAFRLRIIENAEIAGDLLPLSCDERVIIDFDSVGLRADGERSLIFGAM